MALAPLQWSSILKHPDVTSQNGRATRQGSSDSSLSVAILAQDKLEDSFQWCVKITSKVGFIGVGICLENSLKKAAFKKIGWTNIGHGNYVVWEDGQTHSHSSGAINGQKSTFVFGTGDILKLEYNAQTSQLTITKNR